MIKCIQLSRNQRRSVGDKLLISLNIADLMICISSLANLFCYNEYIKRAKNNGTSSIAEDAWKTFGIDWQLFGMGPLLSLGLLTCFITLMLSSTRTLAVVKPFYRIKKRKILLASVIFFVFVTAFFIIKFVAMYKLGESFYSAPQNSTSEYFQGTPLAQFHVLTTTLEQALTLLMVFVAAILSVISITVLKSEDNDIAGQQQIDRQRKAVIMIIILSLTSVVCNTFWITCIIYINIQFLGDTFQQNYDKSYVSLLITLAMITLNSCVNPIVYITKNSALNTYTKLQIRHIIDYFTDNTNSELTQN